MVREMGALMVAIIMAGRTGASCHGTRPWGWMKKLIPLILWNLPYSFDPSKSTAFICYDPAFDHLCRYCGFWRFTCRYNSNAFSALHLEQTQTALTNMWEVYSGVVEEPLFGLIIGLVGCYKGIYRSWLSCSGKSVTSAVAGYFNYSCGCNFRTTLNFLELRWW